MGNEWGFELGLSSGSTEMSLLYTPCDGVSFVLERGPSGQAIKHHLRPSGHLIKLPKLPTCLIFCSQEQGVIEDKEMIWFHQATRECWWGGDNPWGRAGACGPDWSRWLTPSLLVNFNHLRSSPIVLNCHFESLGHLETRSLGLKHCSLVIIESSSIAAPNRYKK